MLNGKVALVTGSTSGIGLGIARALAQSGADVVVNGFGTPEQIEAVLSELRTHGGRVEYRGGDLTRAAEVEALVQDTERTFGRLDVLINNAGIQYTARIEEFPVERWDAILALNLSAAFHAMRIALPGMRARGFGRIVNIASVHGLVASVEKSAYVAAKHGIVGLTKVAALENAEQDITVNAICPGWVRTPLVEKQIQDRAARDAISIEAAERALLAEKQPSLRFVRVEDIAQAVLFLCGPAGASMTGAALVLDGGWTAR